MTVVASNFARKANDLYETPAWCARALLRHYPIKPGERVWEPAAGNHMMADVLRDAGAVVSTSDIVTYDRQHDWLQNFLIPLPGEAYGFNKIISNPPFGQGNRDAVRFAELALERCDGLVALLLTAKFDFGKTRYHLFRDNPRFWAKIALTDRPQWFEGPTSGTEDFAWVIWGPRGGSNRKPIMLYADKSEI